MRLRLFVTKNTAKDATRLAQVGYDRIAKTARITKRNAALIVERLIEKGFVILDRPADPLRRIPSQYRILGYKAALDELSRRQRHWVVRSGNGVLFVHPVNVTTTPSTTVVVEPTITVAAGQSTTVVAATTVTMVAEPTTTVVATTTLLDNKKERQNSQPSSSPNLTDICGKMGIILDDDAAQRILNGCRVHDKTASNDEIAYFAAAKINQLRNSRNISNVVGLLITAIPEYFAAPAHELQRYRAEKTQETMKTRTLANEILNDAQSTEEDRQWAESILAKR